MEEGNGFFLVHRKILDSVVFDDPITLKVWIWCLAKATYKERDIILDGTVIHLMPGEFVTGRNSACMQLKIGETEFRNRIKILQRFGKICVKSTNKFSKITVVNWDYYQHLFKNATNRQPTDNQQTTTNNKENKRNNNIGEQSSPQIPKDMSFKNQRRYKEDSHWDEPSIDADTGEEIPDGIAKEKAEVKELNEKIRHNLKLVEPIRGCPFGTGGDMNFQIKYYRELLKAGWSHEKIISTLLGLINSDYWKAEKKLGKYPGMNTVQSQLRNQKPS